MRNAPETEPAMQAALSGSTPACYEVQAKPDEVITLVVAAWVGKKRYCEARVIHRGPDSLTVLAPAPLEQGEQIWFMEDSAAGGMFVRHVVQEGAGYLLELHREKRRAPRWRVDEHGHVEWRVGEQSGCVNVVVLDVSAGGLRFRTADSIPDACEVRVRFAGMVRDGEVRYSLALGGAIVAGVEFD